MKTAVKVTRLLLWLGGYVADCAKMAVVVRGLEGTVSAQRN